MQETIAIAKQQNSAKILRNDTIRTKSDNSYQNSISWFSVTASNPILYTTTIRGNKKIDIGECWEYVYTVDEDRDFGSGVTEKTLLYILK